MKVEVTKQEFWDQMKERVDPRCKELGIAIDKFFIHSWPCNPSGTDYDCIARELLKLKKSKDYDKKNDAEILRLLKGILLGDYCADEDIYSDVLKFFPDCPFKEDIQQRLDYLEDEKNFKRLSDYVKYKKEHPENVVCKDYEDCYFRYTLQNKQYQKYLERYPKGKYTKAAENLIDLLMFKKLDFLEYYKQYPKGRFRYEAAWFIKCRPSTGLALIALIIAIPIVILEGIKWSYLYIRNKIKEAFIKLFSSILGVFKSIFNHLKTSFKLMRN